MSAEQLDLTAIRARAEASTPGPWEFPQTIHGDPSIVEKGKSRFLGGGVAECDRRDDYGRSNAEHIAGMDPSTTLQLVAELERLRAAVVKLCGCAPDCDERLACTTVGAPGHFACGWCDVHDQPRHRCVLASCLVLPEGLS